MFSQIYRILDVRLWLETDDIQVFERFDLDYRCFRASDPDDDRSETITDLRARVRLSGSSPQLEFDGIVQPLSGHPHPQAHALNLIVRELFGRVRAFVLVHASVAVRNGRAVILSGDAGIGKTTLLLHLLRDRAFTFFSDDVCPLERTSGRVFPFPRTAWIRSEPEGDSAPLSGAKRPVVLDQILAGTALTPCRPGHVFLLAGDPPREIAIRVLLKRRATDDLISALSLAGAFVTDSQEEDNCLVLRYPAGGRAGREVRRTLDRRADEIWSFTRIACDRPDFVRGPEVGELGARELAFRLASQLKNDVLIPDSLFSPGQIMFELASLLSGAKGYLVKTGRLESVAELVVSLC
ncbi:MAG: hypothetical protein ACE15E_17405 [Acidobacteriota bacterium]